MKATLNHIFRTIWSEALNTWVAVSELTPTKGKSRSCVLNAAELAENESESGNIAKSKTRLRLKPIIFALAYSFTLQAEANPTGAQVISGSASIKQSGNLLTVTNSPNAIINWQGFSIGAGQTTNFIQQSASSSVLNRVVGPDPSTLLGTLTSNGKVFLINPAGILVGQGARIDVGSFIASTLNLSNADFHAGKINFTANANAGTIQNQGTITTPEGGSVYLVAPQVENYGVITTPQGETILAAGNTVQLMDTGTPGVSVQLTGSNNTATNLGQILADSGQIGVVGAVVKNSGSLNANSLVSQGGRVFLKASNSIEAGGTISAEGATGGGNISVLADMQNGTVNVTGTLDASVPSPAGGGLGRGSTSGSAAGTSNGGFIETSAADVTIADSAHITTSSVNGKNGTWLIDPRDFNIGTTDTGTVTGGSVIGGDISGVTLGSALNSSSVTILSSQGTTTSGSGNVNVNASVSWSANTVLTLTASNNINLYANITATGTSAGIALNPNTANGSETASGTGTLNSLISAQINLPNVSSSSSTAFVLNGQPYAVINSLGVAADATSGNLTLQGVAATANLASNKYFFLGSNIDASSTASWNSGAGFAPIGNSTTPFNGVFRGGGHTISNLSINLPGTSNVGLFGKTSSSTEIHHVILSGGSVTGASYVGDLVGENYGLVTLSSVSGSVTGLNAGNEVGGMVGSNYGTIRNSQASGTVSGTHTVGGLVGYNSGSSSMISGSDATGGVNGTSYSVGGLAGASNGTISNSYATGNVSGTGNNVGGLVGYGGTDSISNSYAMGNVNGTANFVGGLVGRKYNGTVSNSYALGNVSGTGSNYVGGLVGQNYGSGVITNTYASGTVSGSTNEGGLAGNNANTVSYSYWNSSNANGIGSGNSATSSAGLSTTQMKSASSFVGFTFTTNSTLGGSNSSNWVIVNADGSLNSNGVSGGGTFPMLASEYSAEIRSAHQLQLIAMNLGANYVLDGNIDASSTGASTDVWGSSGFVPIGSWYPAQSPFTGSFNGKSNTISNLTINLPSTLNAVGLFSYAATGSVIKNVGLIGSNVTGGNTTGALVGMNSGSISNAYSTGTVTGGPTSSDVGGLVGSNYGGTISDSHVTGNTSGVNYIGGLAGSNTGNGSTIHGLISNSFSTGTVTGSGNYVGGLVGYNQNANNTISNSYATGSVSGAGTYVGGLVGGNNANSTITNSYATGNVSSSDIYNSYVGGLVGYNQGAVSYSYALGSVSGSSYVGGLAGYNSGGVTNSYATGIATGTGSDVGGLVGDNAGSVIISYWNSANTYGVGLGNSPDPYSTGISTANMMTASSFAVTGLGFSFTTTAGGTGWVIVDANGTLNNASSAAGATFPMLASEYSTTINNAHQLQLIGMNATTLGASYTVGSNIIALSTGNVSDIWGASGFVPVGNANATFTGTFNGLGHTISNLFINQSAATNVGLFGYTATGSTISNVSLLNGIVIGSSNVGQLVGMSNSVITNSQAAGTVGGASNIGGLVGNNSATVTGSSSAGVVAGTSQFIGGLVGYNAGTTINSSSSANVAGGSGVYYIGGLAGFNNNLIQNSTASGIVAGGTGSQEVGGLLGMNGGTLTKGFATGLVTGGSYVGGLVGTNNGQYVSVTISSSGASGMVIGTGGFIGGLVGNNNSIATSAIVTTSYATGSVTGLDHTGGLVGNNSGNITNSYFIGSVSGTSSLGGLAGYNTGTIASSFSSGNVNCLGGSYIGGLAGFSSGTISNSYATGNVTGSGSIVGGLVGNNAIQITDSYETGSVSGASSFGGLVGLNNGTISNSFWNSDVNSLGISNNYGTLSGSVTGLSAAQQKQIASFTGWSISETGGTSDTWRIYQGNTTPLLINFLKPLTLTGAPDAVLTYNGTTQSGGTTSISTTVAPLLYGGPASGTGAGFYNGYYSAQLGYDLIGGNLTISPMGITIVALAGNKVYDGSTTFSTGQLAISNVVNGDTVSLSAGTASTSNKNVGTWPFTSYFGLALTGPSASNYTVSGVSGSGTITQLGSVAWNGGTTGIWSNPSNWAGGAIPDGANVALVSIPANVTVTYDSGVVGTTTIGSLNSLGNLAMSAGSLSTTGNLNTAGYTQTGGTLSVGGNMTVSQSFSKLSGATGSLILTGANSLIGITQSSGDLNFYNDHPINLGSISSAGNVTINTTGSSISLIFA